MGQGVLSLKPTENSAQRYIASRLRGNDKKDGEDLVWSLETSGEH